MHRYNALDSPLLRVSRPVAACSRCRAAKIKCDGKLPACTACEKTGRESECSSSNDQFAKGKERSYVASLEARVEKLHRRIAYAQSRKASVIMHEGLEPQPAVADRKDSLAQIRSAIHEKAARRREAIDVNELVSDFGLMSVNATTRDFETSTSNMTFGRLVLAASQNEPLPKVKIHQMPSRPAAMDLVQYYLDNVFSLFPAFPETALFTAIDAVYQDPPREMSAFDHWLLYMVLAIGSMGQSRSSSDAYYKSGVVWAARALKYADEVLVPGYMTQIQAMIVLVQYSMLDPAHFDSWQLIGITCRAIMDLGFHQDPPKGQLSDKKFLEQRRRLFYCAYSLDRSISMVHARPFSFTDDSTCVAFPFGSSSSKNGSENSITKHPRLDTAMLLFQLRKAQSTWYQELFQSSRDPLQDSSTYLWQMCNEMRLWSETFPTSISPAIRELFDLELFYSYVYCLAPSCRFPAVSEIGKTLIFEYSLAYMQKIYPISKDPVNTAFYTYHDALRVYFIGSQFMAVLSNNIDSLLEGLFPYTTVNPNGPPPPPILNIGRNDNIERSILCIEQIIETLKTYGKRWDDSKALQGSFESQSRGLLAELRRRQQHRDNNSPNSTMTGNMASLVMAQQDIKLRMDDGWANMGLRPNHTPSQIISNPDLRSGLNNDWNNVGLMPGQNHPQRISNPDIKPSMDEDWGNMGPMFTIPTMPGGNQPDRHR